MSALEDEYDVRGDLPRATIRRRSELVDRFAFPHAVLLWVVVMDVTAVLVGRSL